LKSVNDVKLRSCLSVGGVFKPLHEKDKLHQGALVVEYPGTSSVLAAEKLKKSKEVEYVYPLYQYDQAEVALTNDFVVKLKSQVGKSELRTLTQALNITVLKQDKYDPNIYYLRVTSSSAGDVLEMSNYFFKTGKVEFSEPDLIQFVQKHTTDPLYSQQWSIRNTGQYSGTPGSDMDVELAWTITTGSPLVKIAVLDEGVDLNHPDLKANLLPGYDATGLGSAGGASNNDAHGTACSGQIAAVANNNLGGTGIAYGCKVIPVRIAYEGASGSWVITNAGTADAINWAWSNGASILSNSWGGGSPSSLIINAFNAAFTNGRGGLGSVVLASSGNGNTTSVKFPSNIPNIIAVGASSMCDERKSPTSCDGETWWGCDYGTGLDVVAPGVKISTTDISGSAGYNTGDYTSTFNGTSSACPNTAAVMALILSANPNISANAARIALESTCEKIGGYSYSANTPGQPNGTWAFETGYGRVNAYNAVLAALNNPTNCLGTTVLTAATGT
ncbi:MAG: S8 family serine peptidase, partial [Cytophagales bacterium]|nr:S8 family serine peptidase [Cytophagales bacterium]